MAYGLKACSCHPLKPEVCKTSVLTWIKLHKCPCKVYHVNEYYKQLYNLAKPRVKYCYIFPRKMNDLFMPLNGRYDKGPSSNMFIKWFIQHAEHQNKEQQIKCNRLSEGKTGWPIYCRDLLGCYFHQNCTWMCLPDLENLTFSIPIFCLLFHLSVYNFRRKSTQVWPNWVLFTIICPKYTQFM